MTTISRLLARILPGRLVPAALVVIYAVMLIGVLMNLGVRSDADIIYLDIRNT